MKSRLVSLFGRIGSVIMVVGLSLILISMVPPAATGTTSNYDLPINPEKYIMLYAGTNSLQAGFRISVNNSVQIYLLSTQPLQIVEWGKSWVLDHLNNLDDIYNVSVLDVFLQDHLQDILLNKTLINEREIDFFPLRTTNITLIIPNLSLSKIDLNVKVRRIITLAPVERVITPAAILVTSSIVLILPWATKKSKLYLKALKQQK